MTFSDSVLLFEIAVEDLNNYVLYRKDFRIKVQFANLFELYLMSPKKIYLTQKGKGKCNKKFKAKVRRKTQKGDSSVHEQLHYGQSVLLMSNTYLIISNMKKYCLELSLWTKTDRENKMGSVLIPWSKTFIDYLNDLGSKGNSPVINGVYNVFDEKTAECIAVISLRIKLTAIYIDNKLNNEYKCVSANGPNNHFICSLDNCNLISVLSKVYEPVNTSNVYRIMKKISKNSNKAKVKKRNVKKDKGNIPAKIVSTRNESIPSYTVENYIKYTKSDSIMNGKKQLGLKKSLSDSKVSLKNKYNIFDYIFGDPHSPKPNKVYYVYYFTVNNDKSGTSGATSKTSLGNKPSQSSNEQKKHFRIKKCKSECLNKTDTSVSSQLSLDLPHDIASSVSIGKCRDLRCDSKTYRKLPDPPDDAILLDLTHLKGNCCDKITEKIEEVVGGVTAKMKIGEDPCFCTCECRFGFTKKTTYCGVCGGYEIPGEELARKPAHEIPHPCPIFHKLADKNKLKTLSTSGSESKKDTKSMKTGSLQKTGASDKRSTDKKSVESEKDQKKSKKKDDRFKFNYGYKAPQIGHSKCALPCTGTLGNVPKNMGWLWTAEDIPGMKFRPMWKPGATSKHVVRLLKIARNPEQVISKKRKRDSSKKRPLKRPLLIVHKSHGEFTVTMETMKTYTKQRALNQHPYEDKPVFTYTIGRTEEENRDRRMKKERAQRRLERAQRHFIQDTFKDMCREICLKTYQQALGILPETEDPECRCYPAQPTADKINMDVSCSCSEDSGSIGSDTDSDEWVVEFTPPNALFDPTYKGKKIVKTDNGSQYTYLDYRIKLVDRFGNPVPRFFKGPDGKQQCSDLGGFWSPDHKWLEINTDGFVAPDGRWAPNIFIGPSGEQVDAETGKFQATNGKWLVVGVDGYVDHQGKWRFYPKPRSEAHKKIQGTSGRKGGAGDKNSAYKSETSWSCLGDASPKQLSKLGIVGHGQDKKLLGSILKAMLARGENVRIPQPSMVFRLAQKSKKNVKTNLAKRARSYYEERMKCRHRVPSDKGIVAVDSEGNKTYFKLKDFKNMRPRQRIATLAGQGISLNSFHVPCFNSFINSELMKKQQRERLMKLAGHDVGTQV